MITEQQNGAVPETEPQNVAETVIPDNHWAALDIGSNSFHFVYARERDHHLQILHREKYPVQLAAGLDADNRLSEAAMEQGLEILRQLALTTENLSSENFRVVATYTLRRAVNAKAFLARARAVFPFDIEIISGHEEARLIYQGVAHNHAGIDSRLVIDIGGGSTECVIGQHYQSQVLASVPMGCVSYQQRFFADGVISQEHFDAAIIAAKLEMESIVKRFKSRTWQRAIGTSGTIKTLFNLVREQAADNCSSHICLDDLKSLQQQLIACAHVDNIKIGALKEKRRRVLCPGLAILIAVFEMLSIAEMEYCDYSLRDGVLFEMLAIDNYQDVRQRTVDSLQERFSADLTQVDNVYQVASAMYNTVAPAWQLSQKIYHKLLGWAIQVHEVGLDINPSGYHKHGEYILENTDLPGFNQEQQLALAWLVGNQRNKFQPLDDAALNVLSSDRLHRLCALLRLAVLLQQQRELVNLPDFKVVASSEGLALHFPVGWLQQRYLLAADLHNETKQLAKIGLTVSID